MRPIEFYIELTVQVDNDEVATKEQLEEKKREIKKAIEGLDPSIGIFEVQSFNDEF